VPGCEAESEHGSVTGAVVEAAGAARAGESALDNFYASRALRRLVLFGNEDGSGGEAARSFTGRLWGDVLKGRCAALLTTHGVKVRQRLQPPLSAHPGSDTVCSQQWACCTQVLAAVSQCGDARARQEAAAELSEVVEGPLDAWAAALLGQEHFGARRK